MDLLIWAQSLTEQILAESLPRRWAHSMGVGRRGESLADILGEDAELLAAAAWLHDIGYAPGLAKTGFHPIDGARYLRDVEGADPRLCALVAHHSCACVEAKRRGLADALLAEFEPADGLLTDAMIFCDITVTPEGRDTTPEDRLAEILERYGPGTIVYESMAEASPVILGAARRVSGLVAAQG